ncbi:hypothetical protein DQ04_03291000 [Trypanosoma grayi]|uniref:hypothetical protein n=1 Tax=Trypanosoma grayi TaxID=71804 RepID=UPI0004F485B3|nr:hypothetical protein DQ04_03291000 [Trypanosoma grayi]KEG10783.1 hypothetical protein DQ04_03291000 [Trypanosoma grayi]
MTELQENSSDRVKSELTAMALDAWYNVYSTTLSEDPSRMPTCTVTLSEPLVEVLQPAELDRLIGILGLQRDADGTAPQSFFVTPGLLGPGRRFDRPLINAERDVREYFDELFASRGAEITRQCLANERWIW